MIYFQVILIAVIITAIAEKLLKHRILFFVLSVLSIVGPVWLAASRDLSIGYDVNLYVVKQFNIANSGVSFLDFCNNVNDYFLFKTLVYLITNITHDIGLVLGSIELIICFFFYMAAYNNRERIPMWLFMLAFYCFGYIYSFNIMKQMISISILVYSIKFYEENKWKRWALFLTMAVLFHISTLMFLIVPLIDSRMKKYSRQLVMAGDEEKIRIRAKLKRKIFYGVIIVVILCAFVYFGLNSILKFMVTINLFANKAYTYMNKYARTAVDFEMYKLALQALWLMFIFKCRKRFLAVEENYLLILMLIISFGFTLLGGKVNFLERTGLTFGMYPMCVGYGQISNFIKLKCGHINIATGIIICLFIFTCWWQFIVCNQAAAYPYVFR